jgi:Flp pilus assembly CpaF family ATPase
VNADNVLVTDLHRRVTDELSRRLQEYETDGTVVDPDTERQLTRSIITEALEQKSREDLSLGRLPLDRDTQRRVATAVFNRTHGLGRIQRLIDDPAITNIHINGPFNVFTERADGTRVREEAVADSVAELTDLIQAIARRSGRSEKRWDDSHWFLNVQLADGSRLHAVRGVTGLPVVTIRRHNWTISRLDHLLERALVDEVLVDFLRYAVRSKLNIVVAGATNSGKTTVLRCLINEIPSTERIVTVEDNLEIGLDRFIDLHPDQVIYEARPPNAEGAGEVTLAQCMRESLRQNPDRVILGEVRGAEIREMFRAMSQGNDGSMCSVHADSSVDAIERLRMYCSEAGMDMMAATQWLASAVDLIVHLGWADETTSHRRRVITSIREITGFDGDRVTSNEVFRPGKDGMATPAPGPAITEATLRRMRVAGFDSSALVELAWTS